MNMGPKEFAVRTGKPEKTIIAVLKGESSITPDMAGLFESVTRIPARFWMNKQRSYDEYLARKRQLALIDEEMNKNGNETIKHESQQVL
jgi:plasmid maintenance system antidote protein VapI